MRFKQLLTKTLLVAAGLCVGANSAWGSTHYILNQNFDSQPSVWSNAVNGVSYALKTAEGTDYYVSQNGRSSGHNANWYSPTRDWSDDINEYIVEFDYKTNVSSSYLNAYIALMDEKTYTKASGSTRMDYGFQSTSAANATNNLFWAQSTAVADGVTTYTIKYLVSGGSEVTNGPTFTMANNTWYHFAITINKTSKAVSFVITSDGKANQSGDFTAQSTTGICTGIAIATPRSGSMGFDNFVMTNEVAGDVAAVPEITLTGLNGTERTYTITYLPGETLHYVLPGGSEETASGSTTKVVSTSTSGTLRAWTTNGTATSEDASVTVDATAVTLNTPWIYISNMTANGSYYNVTLNGGHDQSSVLLSPAASLSATFTPEGGVEGAVSLPYTATNKGTLKVTSSAEGYTSAIATFNVEGLYEQSWQSVDFSSLSGAEAIGTAVGGTWTLLDDHGRWASWNKSKDGSYNFYQHGTGSTSTVTVNDKIRMREVVILAEGMGLGRNNGDDISVITTAGQIVGFEMYNGYGDDINKGSNTYKTYVKNTSGNPSVHVSNGALLVQATIYAPIASSVSATVTSVGYATFSSPYNVDFSNEAELTVYKAKVNGAKTSVVLTAIDSKKVPANTGVILAGSAATYTGAVAASADAVTENDLLASTDNPAEINDYILVNEGGTAVFAPMTSGSLATGKAYLPADKCPAVSGDAKSLKIVFDDETLGISDATLLNGNAEGMKDNAIYNLSGQRIAAPQKGINIVNGKKIIVK